MGISGNEFYDDAIKTEHDKTVIETYETIGKWLEIILHEVLEAVPELHPYKRMLISNIIRDKYKAVLVTGDYKETRNRVYRED